MKTNNLFFNYDKILKKKTLPTSLVALNFHLIYAIKMIASTTFFMHHFLTIAFKLFLNQEAKSKVCPNILVEKYVRRIKAVQH